MIKGDLKIVSYFPGCSMKTTAADNNVTLIDFCKQVGIQLVELDDWSCCGSSSAHSIDTELALQLAGRNLAKAPSGIPLLVACPSCILRLKEAHLHLKENEKARKEYELAWGRTFDPDLQIIHFFELINTINLEDFLDDPGSRLGGLKFVPYYGCMLNRPPALRHEPNYHGLLEDVLSSLGAEPINWGYRSKCCGTYLSVARPEIVTPIINEMMQQAILLGADCLVTACAMCHMNIEVRCDLKKQLPTLHFSELLSLALGNGNNAKWYAKHLIDPVPLLKERRLLEG